MSQTELDLHEQTTPEDDDMVHTVCCDMTDPIVTFCGTPLTETAEHTPGAQSNCVVCRDFQDRPVVTCPKHGGECTLL